MAGFIELSGQCFGRLLVLGRELRQRTLGCGQAYWACLCDCGEIACVRSQDLRLGKTKSCGCGRRSTVTVGHRSGQLTTLKMVGRTKLGVPLWRCRCTCGKTCVKTSSFLKNGHVRSCGCLQKKGLGVAAENSVFCAYRTMAKKRHVKFSLTRAEAGVLFRGVCHYCAVSPRQEAKPHRYTNGAFKYNGIDRVNNTRGYEQGNVVSCCGVCNFAKRAMSYDDFVTWLRRIAKKWR